MPRQTGLCAVVGAASSWDRPRECCTTYKEYRRCKTSLRDAGALPDAQQLFEQQDAKAGEALCSIVEGLQHAMTSCIDAALSQYD